MYSNEIDDVFRQHNFQFDTHNEVNEIIKHSPQISIKLLEIKTVQSKYRIWSSDGFNWDIWIRNYNK